MLLADPGTRPAVEVVGGGDAAQGCGGGAPVLPQAGSGASSASEKDDTTVISASTAVARLDGVTISVGGEWWWAEVGRFTCSG